MSYRGSHKTQNNKQMILKPQGIESKAEAEKLVGKTAVWQSRTGKKIEGKISSAHGNSGAIRVIFAEKGLPGQALGTIIEII